MNYIYLLSFIIWILLLWKASIKDFLIHRIDIRLVLLTWTIFTPFLYSENTIFWIINIILIIISFILLFLENKWYIDEEWWNVFWYKIWIIDIYPLFLLIWWIIVFLTQINLANPILPLIALIPLVLAMLMNFIVRKGVISWINNLDNYFTNIDNKKFDNIFWNNLDNDTVVEYFYKEWKITNFLKKGSYNNNKSKIKQIQKLRLEDINYNKETWSCWVPMYPYLFPSIIIILWSIFFI